MEKWRCRGKHINKAPHEKGKKWTLSGLLKRISKNETITSNVDKILSNSSNQSKNSNSKNIQSYHDIRQSSSCSSIKAHNQPIKHKYHEKAIENLYMSEHESQDSSINLNNPSMHSRNSESSSETFRRGGGNNSRRNLIKARIKAKRERYYDKRSSSDDEHNSNYSLAIIQSEDNLQNMYKCDNNRRSRGARTERYMKRLYRDDINGSNDHHEAMKNGIYTVDHTPLIKTKKKYPSDVLSLYVLPTNDNLRVQQHRKMPSYYQPFNHQDNTRKNILSKNAKYAFDLYDNDRFFYDKWTRSPNYKSKHIPITNSTNKHLESRIFTLTVNKSEPPVPPPRSCKSRLCLIPLQDSLQNSDIENGYLDLNTATYKEYSQNFNVNCNSLDRIHSMSHKCSDDQSYYRNELSSRHSFNGESTFSFDSSTNDYTQRLDNQSSDVDYNSIETPIVPNLQKLRKITPPAIMRIRRNKTSNMKQNKEDKELKHKRHSKNLEEALQELETIYNSLHLNNDEDLLDRAEQRSMDEYRDKIAAATVEGSIKSSSDISTWRHTTTFDQCYINATRLKDDMAYRRIHQNERSSSVDPKQMSLSGYSYLANSRRLSNIDDTHYNGNIFLIDNPKSRRGTPDLMRDDVVYRTINHTNNTLKIIEPQPPFGIPLGPVTTAAESDYLHIEPTRNSTRSSYIPQSEPDVICDDLAFRNLRKDTMKNRPSYSYNMNFIPKAGRSAESKKRAVRSLSADLYGIINKSDGSQHAWYKEYVKLNRPGRLANCSGNSSDNEFNTNSWISNREYVDLDINGNSSKSTYHGRIQVCVPQEDKKLTENSVFQVNKTIDKNEDKYTSSSLPESDIDTQIPNVTKTVGSYANNNELTEYKQLCHNLECLINKISEKAKCVDTKDIDTQSKNNSIDNLFEWKGFLDTDDTELVDTDLNGLLKLSGKNEITVKQMTKEKSVKEKKDDERILCKLFDNHTDVRDSLKNSMSQISAKHEKKQKNEDNNFVIDKNTCTQLNLLNNVPCKPSGITEVISNMEIINKNNTSRNDKDTDDSSTSIDLNQNENSVKYNKTKDLTVLKPLSTASFSNLTCNDADKEHNDCTRESSVSKGRETTL